MLKINVPTWERFARVAAGIAIILFGIFGPRGGTSLGYFTIGAGVVAILTGAVGFCPVCAVAGRRSQ